MTQPNDFDLFYQDAAAPSPSTSRTDLIRAIEEAEAEKRAQRENDPDKRIQAARAELERLNEQQRQADLAADVAANEQHVRTNEQVIQDFLRQLTSAIVPLDQLTKPPFAVDQTYAQQQAFVSNALGRYGQAGNTAEKRALLNSPDYLVQEAARNAERMDYLSAESRFKDGAPVWIALAQWIHQSANPGERQLRTGVAYAIVGYIIEADDKFDYERQKNEDSAAYRRRFSRS